MTAFTMKAHTLTFLARENEQRGISFSEGLTSRDNFYE